MSEDTEVHVVAKIVLRVPGSGDDAKERAVQIACERYPGLPWIAERVVIPWGT